MFYREGKSRFKYVLEKSIWGKKGVEPPGRNKKLVRALSLQQAEVELKMPPTLWLLAPGKDCVGACAVGIYELVQVVPCGWTPGGGK